MKTGSRLIQEERRRQQDVEGWGAGHDANHRDGEMAYAAMCYASPCAAHEAQGLPARWPWDSMWWKPSRNPVKNLIKAGALIAAEIDRLQRADSQQAETETPHDLATCKCAVCEYMRDPSNPDKQLPVDNSVMYGEATAPDAGLPIDCDGAGPVPQPTDEANTGGNAGSKDQCPHGKPLDKPCPECDPRNPLYALGVKKTV